MIRALLYAVLAIIITFAGVWLKDNPAEIRINWLGYEVYSSLWVVVIVLCLAWLVLKIISLPFNFLDFIDKKRKERREKAENRLIADFLTALGTNDRSKYASLIRRINKVFSDKTNLRDLMLLSISTGSVKQHAIENLSKEKDTRLLALKSRIDLSEEGNNKEETLSLYLDAFNKYPKAEFIPPKLISLLALFGRWNELKEITNQSYKNGTILKDRRDTILSSALLEEGMIEGNDAMIKEAANLDMGNVAAVINASRSYVKEGDKDKAFSLLKKVWQTKPCYSVYETVLMVTSEEPEYKRLRKIEKLLNSNKDFDLYNLLMADIYGKSHIWGQAKEYLELYESTHGMSPLLTRVKADVTFGETPDSPNAKNLLDMAISCPMPAPWQCSHCHEDCFEWHGLCPKCGYFGTISIKS